MVHFSAKPKNEPHSPFLRERSLFTSRIPSGEGVINNYFLLIINCKFCTQKSIFFCKFCRKKYFLSEKKLTAPASLARKGKKSGSFFGKAKK
ncbi:MAG: hypothetical protein U5L45_07670 [Saprospiraceae bacterium]|nr:hypothetical protein [Saprospiraceae bacterium]